VDGDGSVVVAATLVDQVELDDGLRSSAGGQDILVVKLDTDGVLLWSRSWGSSQDDRGYDASVDATGHILITGRHAGPLDLGNGLHPSQGGPFDAFLMKLRPNGDLAWAWFFGSPGDEAIGGTAIDSAGNVIFSAAFHETVDFGGGALTSAGDYDVVIAQYAP
jgi:hypothetical protein